MYLDSTMSHYFFLISFSYMEILCYLLYELALISWICGSQFVTLNLALHPPGDVGDSHRLFCPQALHSTERMSLDIPGPQPSTPNNHNK